MTWEALSTVHGARTTTTLEPMVFAFTIVMSKTAKSAPMLTTSAVSCVSMATSLPLTIQYAKSVQLAAQNVPQP